MSRDDIDNEAPPLPPHGAPKRFERGRERSAACSSCRRPAPISELSSLGSMCQRCFDRYCAGAFDNSR